MWDLNKTETGKSDGGGGERPPIDWVEIAEPVARDLLGEPNRHLSDKRQLRWGGKGSISLEIRTGRWFDHEQGEGGGVLALVERELRCDRAGAMEWLEQQGYVESLDPSRPVTDADRRRWEAQRAEHERKNAERAAIQDEKTARRRALAARQWHGARPVDGTLALTYLRDMRKINRGPEGAARYTPAFEAYPGDENPRPAVLFPITNDAGEVVAVQAVRLDADGRKARDLGDRAKTTLGPVGTGFLRLPGTGPLHVAEGPETGLSVWLATGAPVLVCFGAISANRIEALPVNPGDTVVIAGDASAPGSAVEATLSKAISAGVARGLAMRLAVPAGEAKTDWNDVLQAQGVEAVRAGLSAAVAAPPEATRAADGRFTGGGPVAMPPVTPPVFHAPAEIEGIISAEVESWVDACRRWHEDATGPAPVLAIAASAGSGKSAMTQKILAAADKGQLPGDIIWHAPTTAMNDEGAGRISVVEELRRNGAHVTRGRAARNPATGETMCARPRLADETARQGLPVYPNLCERPGVPSLENLTPEPIRCPHFATCAHRLQWAGLPADESVLRFESQAYLTLPGDGSSRPVAARVIDETFLQQLVRRADLSREEWLADRRPRGRGRERDKVDHAEIALRLPAAALAVWEALEAGHSPVLADYAAEDFDRFAQVEDPGALLQTNPASSDAAILGELKEGKADPRAGARAAVWRILADAKRRGLEYPERLRIARSQPIPGTAERRDVLRATWRRDLPRDVPLLILDADMTPEILQGLCPGARYVSAAMKPNAHVTQVSDRRLTNRALLTQPQTRREAVDVVRWEAYQDRLRDGGGTLAAATKSVVRSIFSDAGLVGDEMSDAEATEIMKATRLHGARWIWFGPASKGVNDYEAFTTVVILGREEPPLAAVQDEARALFGDGARRLQLVDEVDGANYDEELVPYLMADGSGAGVVTRLHRDPVVRALQRMRRERATMQAIERLRLGRAAVTKRVVIACSVPIPGLPVNALVHWDQLRPTRLQAAMAEVALRGDGVLRLSAAGLAADAPQTFKDRDAAHDWLRTGGRAEVAEIKWGVTSNIYSTTGDPLFNPTPVDLRLEGQRGRATPALILVPGDVRQLAERQFGPVRELVVPPPAAVADGEDDAETPARNTPDARETPAAQPPPVPPGEEPCWAEAMELAHELQEGHLNERACNVGFIGAMTRLADGTRDVPPEDLACVIDGNVLRLFAPDPRSAEAIEAADRRSVRKALALRSPRCERLKAKRDAERNRLAAE